MPVASYTMPVNAPAELVWKLVRDSAEFPQRFAPGVAAVRVFDRDGNSWLREMRLRDGVQRERISVGEVSRTVTAELVDHPLYTGSVVSRVEVPGASATQREPRLSFRMEWTARDGKEDGAAAAALSSALERELLAVKRAAELRAAQLAA
jgi:hypothetical protein